MANALICHTHIHWLALARRTMAEAQLAVRLCVYRVRTAGNATLSAQLPAAPTRAIEPINQMRSRASPKPPFRRIETNVVRTDVVGPHNGEVVEHSGWGG